MPLNPAPPLMRLLCLPCLLALPAAALAQSDAPEAAAAPAPAASAVRLRPVVVTATRIETPAFDVPASIDRVGSETLRDGRAQVNISEGLGGVPGLMARDRQNYAQDVQISVRGFGARAAFGIRGVRLYIDDIPATFPDGQGQISNVELGSVDRIEVLRGPFSALYGNSSGGVVQVFTEDPAPTPTWDFGVSGGSDGALRIGTKLSGQAGALGYVLGASHFRTDGYREHSAAERDLANLKLVLRPDDTSSLTFLANSVDLPKAQDPLGLTRAQFEADPRGVAPVALSFDTRKTVDQTQGGVIYERRVDEANTLRVLAYTGHRNTLQFQSIPTGPQANPLHPGGVIALSSTYRGTDLRWTTRGAFADRPFTLVAGLAYDELDQHRFGYQNFVGAPPNQTLGVQGALRRDEIDTAANFDQYLQGTLQLAPAWSITAGLRHSRVRFDSADRYIAGPNGDDSGATRYSATVPVLGVLYALNERVHLYATAGRGFETPTFNELAYRPDGTTGLNFALQPARSDNAEVGVKTRTDLGEMTAALFETRTHDEIVTLTNSGGRATFQNAGSTRRSGAEVAWSATWAEYLRAQAAATWLDATYREGERDGKRIPGVARSALYAALAWAPPQGWRGGIDLRRLSRVVVDDANSDAAPGYFIAGANVGYVARFGAWQLTGFARGDNLFDRKYAGSVIVNEGNQRFFEPAPGRTWLVGVSSSLSF